MTITLQRARTAREAVEILGVLTEEYGARLDNYMIADPSEVWMWEEFQGHRWVAVRVPDDCFVVEANNCRITNIDLNDRENYMGSKDVIDFAVKHGLYDPSSGDPFSCVKAYSDRGEVRYDIPAPKYNTRRVWRGISLLAPSTNLDPEAEYFPLFVKPDWKLTPGDLLKVLRDHYQGTPYDLYAADHDEYKYSEMHINKKRQYQLSPSWNTERPIGISRSRLNWVAQLRSWLPNPIGGVLWGGIGAAWANGHVPWYVGITKTPAPYNIGTNDRIGKGTYEEGSAYWVYETVANLVNLFWRNTIEDVLPIWEEWENKLYRLQPSVEKAALELYGKKPDLAVKYLTSYSCSKGVEALEMAKAMIPKLISTIASKNTGI
jgi:dipeptidase